MTSRSELIEAARGTRPLDLVLRNARLVNVLTCEIYPADVGVYADRIAVVGPAGVYDLRARQDIDASGQWLAPGFVDTHLHIESTMVTPPAYAAGVLPRGTTTSIIDPHEIGNVLGRAGVRYMLDSSADLPLAVYVCIPSCVPAVDGAETAGARFTAEDVAAMLAWPRVIGVAEVMDYQGVIRGDERMLDIVQAGLDAEATVQGHSPLLKRRDANAYIAAGIHNDHELRDGEEGLEKLRLGLLPLLKVSSHGNHVPNILPSLLQAPHVDIALCTDDVEPADLLRNGHMDRVVREMLAHGVEPCRALRWASWVGAQHYGLRDRGAIAPGYKADMVLLESLEEVRVGDVFAGGRRVARGGALTIDLPLGTVAPPGRNSVRLKPFRETDLMPQAPIRDGVLDVNVMHILPSRLTERRQVRATVRQGVIALDSIAADACFVAVLPRHGQSHGPGLSLLTGLGLRKGALASTVVHDSHNLLAVGRNAADMAAAARHLEAIAGGICIAVDGCIRASVALPIAGLMSAKSVPEVAQEMDRLNAAAVALGITHRAKGLATTGLALTVIPEVSASDWVGLLDVDTQEAIPLFT